MRNLVLICVFTLLSSCASNRDQYIIRALKQTSTQPYIPPKPLVTDNTPDAIPATILPAKAIYDIRLRIVVSHNCVLSLVTSTPITVVLYSAESINQSIEFANNVFKQVGIRFHVVECEFMENKNDYREYWVDALKHTDCISVYFMSPNNFTDSGMSVFPWVDFPEGIVLSSWASNNTLPHEFGHYFGLLHTFDVDDPDGDFCSDTIMHPVACNDIASIMGRPVPRPNCGNVMNYCMHNPIHFTPNQIERMIRYLRASRMNKVMPGTVPNNLEVLKKSFAEFHQLNP